MYSSPFISDEEARAELVRKNPKIVEDGREPRIVKFRAGRYRRMWVGNVVGIGNSSGFVEPLEATALATIVVQCRSLAFTLFDCLGRPTPGLAALYNQLICGSWDEVRDFIGVHYKFNTMLDTPFWRACRADTDLGAAQRLVDFFQENGPSVIHEQEQLRPSSIFGLEGYLTMLVGQRVRIGRVISRVPRSWSAGSGIARSAPRSLKMATAPPRRSPISAGPGCHGGRARAFAGRDGARKSRSKKMAA